MAAVSSSLRSSRQIVKDHWMPFEMFQACTNTKCGQDFGDKSIKK